MKTKDLVCCFFEHCEKHNISVEQFNLYLCTDEISIELAEESEVGGWYLQGKGETFWGDNITTSKGIQEFVWNVVELEAIFKEGLI